MDPVELRTDVPHSARVYDYFLGGKNNYPADREAAELVLKSGPNTRISALANRAFLHRVARHLAGAVGVRQFLDIGTGIPTSPNLHEIAQGIIPDARVVYADHDPIVLAHARALLVGKPEGRTAYIDADLREPEKILNSPTLLETLDLGEPVALSVIAILHFIPDSDDPAGLLRRYLDALPSGSFLAITHVTPDFAPEEAAQVTEIYRARGIPLQTRTRAQVGRFFDGLELLEPGVQVVHRWRPDADTDLSATDAQVNVYGGLARKR
ncbi:SAM-dependent methyltransferase [Frankia sp. CNm7]|uniref:SAM-dependent methyltransferase n=1 Tax=Frankia nepalensis TaxID=1836974 RepID=A0A937US72_9ACTN|nr:SAM-dependent methyltransferase [Frankia nepalensis]MBL7510371.1 SAM-dependent methyltransferase [Frankia nepalensis]MBL7524175.1 SAM-dependent methyltransferase [Frankia nepalensis]MBL7629970.1 SAM-dependent methyltransferase [Frankia nepalensis]